MKVDSLCGPHLCLRAFLVCLNIRKTCFSFANARIYTYAWIDNILLASNKISTNSIIFAHYLCSLCRVARFEYSFTWNLEWNGKFWRLKSISQWTFPSKPFLMLLDLQKISKISFGENWVKNIYMTFFWWA